MKLSEILTPSFKSIGEELGLKVEIFDGRLITWAPRWRQALSVDSEFCKALVSCGYLTERQMLRAALRYRLGATKTSGVIYWQIDNHEETYEGKIMHYLLEMPIGLVQPLLAAMAGKRALPAIASSAFINSQKAASATPMPLCR